MMHDHRDIKTMNKLIAVAVAAVLFAPTSAIAVDAQQRNSAAFRMRGSMALHGWTTTNRAPPTAELFDAGFCAGVLNAAMMYLPLIAGAIDETRGKPPYCLSDQVTVGELNLVIQKYLSDHPEKLHEPFTDIVGFAAAAAFPCAPGEHPQ
jgi:Rap1a immunity proteins